jgi:hypothetical protein
MTDATISKTDALVREFRDAVRLTELDAQRATFTALALRANWSKSKIANYLGISRARATQKVDKLVNYVEPSRFKKEMPVLVDVMEQVDKTYLSPYERSEEADSVRFTVKDWEDPKFVAGMLKLVEPKDPEA